MPPTTSATYDASADTGKRVLLSVVLREKLAANRTYYVRTDGSDSNTGLVNDSGGAFLTVQKAVDVACNLDLATYNVTVNVGAGTRTATTVLGSYLGVGPIYIIGDITTPSNVTTTVTGGNCFTCTAVRGQYNISGFKLFYSHVWISNCRKCWKQPDD